MNCKKNYFKPIVEIQLLNACDIILTSSDGDTLVDWKDTPWWGKGGES